MSTCSKAGTLYKSQFLTLEKLNTKMVTLDYFCTDTKLEHVVRLKTLSPPESIMETCSVVLTFESVDEILWCDHSNETSLTVLLHYLIFIKRTLRFSLNFDF